MTEQLVHPFAADLEAQIGPGFALYRPDISYQPHAIVNVDPRTGKPAWRGTKTEDLMRSPDLNPDHVLGQRVTSRIDPEASNVVYTLPNGEIRVGFYDRTNAELANQFSKGPKDLPSLVQGNHPFLPKLPLVPRQIGEDTLSGLSFPAMFDLRSVLFPNTMPYGLVVSIDPSLIGKEGTLTDIPVTPESVKANPRDLSYLLPLLFQAAKQQRVLDDIGLDSLVEIEGEQPEIFTKIFKPYSIKVSYRRAPETLVLGRFNGIPAGLGSTTHDGKPVYYEISLGAAPFEDQYIGLISKAMVRGKDDADSLAGDLTYVCLERDDSLRLAKTLPGFGLFEVQVMLGYAIHDFKATFERITIQPPVEREPTLVMSRPATPSYTAGATTVRNVRQATIATEQVFPHTLLVRDAFCLVHQERDLDAAPYAVAARH